jgi:flagellar motility protein MotE (MotC chaperone)
MAKTPEEELASLVSDLENQSLPDPTDREMTPDELQKELIESQLDLSEAVVRLADSGEKIATLLSSIDAKLEKVFNQYFPEG